jgi:hypothetical protein
VSPAILEFPASIQALHPLATKTRERCRLEALVSSPRSFAAGVCNSLRNQFVKVLEEPGDWTEQTHLYSAMLVAEARNSTAPIVALDLLSDSLDLLHTYREECDVEASAPTVHALLCDAVTRGHSGSRVLKGFIHLQPQGAFAPRKRIDLPAAAAFITGLMEVPPGIEHVVDVACDWYSRVIARDTAGAVSPFFGRALSFAVKHGEDRLVGRLGSAFEQCIDRNVDHFRLEYVVSALECRELGSTEEFCDALARLGDIKKVESLAAERVLAASALRAVANVRGGEEAREISPALLRTRLNHWESLNEIHRGFTSRLISSKRGPFREPPDVVQFAVDVGDESSVRYINSNDPGAFPGKGFFFTRLSLSKCFAPEPPSASARTPRPGAPTVYDSYPIYKKAWPRLAEAMTHFE